MTEQRTAVVVGRAGEDDWAAARAVRLAALGESPRAFGSTLEAELGLDESRWRARLRESAWFLAVDAGQPIGVVAGVREAGAAATERHLVGFWVAPAHRGAGVGQELLQALRAWAARDGAERLTLWVRRENAVARRAYRRMGFVPVPVPAGVQDHRCAGELRMAGSL